MSNTTSRISDVEWYRTEMIQRLREQRRALLEEEEHEHDATRIEIW